MCWWEGELLASCRRAVEGSKLGEMELGFAESWLRRTYIPFSISFLLSSCIARIWFIVTVEEKIQ